MNDLIKISIIMPVYNSEKYLSKAIESILSQSFIDYELILVDDGSTDNSGKICDDYTKKDKRVVVIHKKNGGICSARNEGLRISQGEYITFCDNDDIYLPGLLEDNYTYAKNHNVDLMRFNRVQKSVNVKGGTCETKLNVTDGIVGCDENFNYDRIRCSNAVWNALYKSEIIKKHNIHFNEKMRFGNEDLDFNLSIIPYCKIFGFNSKVYYEWIMRHSHSTTMKYDKNYFDSLEECIKLESNVIKHFGNNVTIYDKARCLSDQYVYPACVRLNIKRIKTDEIRKMLDKLYNQRIVTYKEFVRNKREIRRYNVKIYIILLLFLKKKYVSLFLLLKFSSWIFRLLNTK